MSDRIIAREGLGLSGQDAHTVRPDFVPKSDYISPDVVRLENEQLWPRVWQIACRVEEIPRPGDFVTYEIGRESIIILRADDGSIKSFFNVCQHRGRQLKDGCGNTGHSIQCGFHGWRWNLDGSLARIKARPNWEGCSSFDEQALRLKETLVDVWGGWVWINMDLQAEPLLEYLSPVPEILEPFLLDQLRFNWYKTIVLPCNWKTALDAFNEGYHTEATHPQMTKYGLSDFPTRAFGKHAMFFADSGDTDAPSTSTGAVPKDIDARKFQLDYVEEMNDTLSAMYTEKAVAAARRLMVDVAPSATPAEVGAAFAAFHREITLAAGAAWPDGLTSEKMIRAGIDWHIFPNTILLPTIDGALWYRARPNGSDPDSCLYDVWSLGRYKDGDQPQLKREFYPDWEKFRGQLAFLDQDLNNMQMVQKGMHSRGFSGSRTNPVQEVSISNFHRVLHQFIYGAG